MCSFFVLLFMCSFGSILFMFVDSLLFVYFFDVWLLKKWEATKKKSIKRGSPRGELSYRAVTDIAENSKCG